MQPGHLPLDKKRPNRKLTIQDVVVANVVSDCWQHRHDELDKTPFSDRTLYFRFVSDVRRIASGLLNLVRKDMDALDKFANNGGSLNRVQFVSLFLQLIIQGSYRLSNFVINGNTGPLEVVCALLELFVKADVNGDETISVEELLTVILGYQDDASYCKYGNTLLYKKRFPVTIFHRKGFDKVAATMASNMIAVKEIGSSPICLLSITPHSVKSKTWNGDIPAMSDVMIYIAESTSGIRYNMLAVGAGKSLLTFPLDAEDICLERSFTSQAITVLFYSSEEDVIFIGFDNGDISTWRLAPYEKYVQPEPRTDQKLILFKGHSAAISGIGYTNEGRLLFSCSMDSTVRLWDAATGNVIRIYKNGHYHGIVGLVMSPATRLLLSAGIDSVICVWNLYSEDVVFQIKGHGVALSYINVLGSSENIVTADIDGVIKIWDSSSFLCLQTISLGVGLSNVCTINDSIAVFHEGSDMILIEPEKCDLPKNELVYQMVLYNELDFTIVTCSRNKLQIWDMLTGKLNVDFVAVTASDITIFCFDRLKRRIAVGACDGQIAVLNSATLSLLQVHPKADSEILFMTWISSPQRIATATATEIRILNQDNGNTIFRETILPTLKVGFASGSSDLQFLLLSSSLEITLFDINHVTTTSPIKGSRNKLEDDLSISAVAFCPDVDIVVISFSRGETCIYQFDKKGNFMLLGHLRANYDFTAIAFSLTLHCIFAGCSSGSIARFDLKSVILTARTNSLKESVAPIRRVYGDTSIEPSWKHRGGSSFFARSICVIEPPVHFALTTTLGRLLIFNDVGIQLCEIRNDIQGQWPINLDVSCQKKKRLEEAQNILNQTDLRIQEEFLTCKFNNTVTFASDCIWHNQSEHLYKNEETKSQDWKDEGLLTLKIRKSRNTVLQCHTTPNLIRSGGLKSAGQRLSSCLTRLSSRRMLHNHDLARNKPYNWR